MDFLRLESRLWGSSLPIRRMLRTWLGRLADGKHALNSWVGRRPRTRIRAFLATEPRTAVADHDRGVLDGPSSRLSVVEPVFVEEALRLVAAAEDLEAVVCALDSPTRESPEAVPNYLPPGSYARWVSLPIAPSSSKSNFRPTIRAKTIPFFFSPAANPDTDKSYDGADPGDSQDDQSSLLPLEFPFASVGGYWLPPGQSHGQRFRHPVYDAFDVLHRLPQLEGPPTFLFLLPFLAVGGAERLLFDLLAELTPHYRCLVVTLEPHRPQLGITLDRCAEHTPYIFTLGDWLPREAHFGALSHLLRRFSVRSLISWNGTVFFFDRVADLRRRFPDLRILSQLYHFEGGWTARTSPAVIRAVDTHLAVNGPIRDALVDRLGVSPTRVELIYHGVPLIPEADQDPQGERTRGLELRAQLGIPQGAVVIGTFIRLHPQKRPLDILKLARRAAAEPSLPARPWFVLMGGGPLDEDIDRDLAERPIPGFTRLPMQSDPLPYYDLLDLCLMTSEYEGLPVFLLDGMARGLPAIAPAVGDVPLLVEDGGGIATGAPGDLEAIEAAIVKLLDPETRAQAAQCARSTIESRFGLADYCAAYERVFLGPPAAGDAHG